MSEDCVVQSLQALADHDRSREVPPLVEARLRAAFRARKLRRVVRRVAARLALGAVAAAGVAAALLLAPRVAPPVMPEIAVAPPAPPPIEVRHSLPRVPVNPPRPVQPPREFVTEFFPLMEPAPPFERGQILRVNVPAAAMRTVGLPVREENLADRIEADVLVGEEGIPRAIRFVSFDAK